MNGLNWEYARQPVSQLALTKCASIQFHPRKVNSMEFHVHFILSCWSLSLYIIIRMFFLHSRDASNRFLIHHYAVIEWHSLNLARGNHARTIYSNRTPILYLRYGRTNKKIEHTHTNYYTKRKAHKSWFCYSVYIAYSVWYLAWFTIKSSQSLK